MAEPNPALASFMLEQFGGPPGELEAAMLTGADLGAWAGAGATTRR